MVSDLKHTLGEGKDIINVTITATEPSKIFSGTMWVIGEYIQRGTTGTMFMPSHNDLNLNPEGKPGNPKSGTKYQVKTTFEKSFTLIRPGFDGEELVAVRIGLVDESGEIQIAKASTQQIAKKAAVKRAKITTP
jgi:hypothetical protein